MASLSHTLLLPHARLQTLPPPPSPPPHCHCHCHLHLTQDNPLASPPSSGKRSGQVNPGRIYLAPDVNSPHGTDGVHNVDANFNTNVLTTQHKKMGRTTFTNITPLPRGVTREVAISFLHDHLEMIDLNPLVIERHTIPPPPHAAPEEHRCIWYSLTDRVSYLPGVSGKVTYTCAFNDLPEGLQTHCYAALGLEIRDRWSVGGSLPGEPPQPMELGLNAPLNGLYLREDVDLRCNSIMIGFVKKTIKKSHGALVDRLATKAQVQSTNTSRLSMPNNPSPSSSSFHPAPPSLGSESMTVSPIGSLLPPNTGSNRQHIRSHSSPPTNRNFSRPHNETFQVHQSRERQHQEAEKRHNNPRPSYQPYQTNSSQPVKSHSYESTAGSNHLGVPQLHAETLELPGMSQEDHSDDGGLKYSGTIYRGNSRPRDYVEFSDMNPYSKEVSTPGLRQPPPEIPRLYPAPLQVPQEKRPVPAELQ
ncbi:hypothetical protein BGZ63DRAFT_463000 [Mariannaea sp. PMI_226]|nr:hypothetical protein BGZ63DRAFT_463000 [Mariannaea sp. PMI_226]